MKSKLLTSLTLLLLVCLCLVPAASAEWDGPALTSVTIPADVTVIEAEAFSGCASMEKLTLPAGVEQIGDGAFSGCGALREIHFDGSAAQWDSLTIGGDNEALYCAALYCGGVLHRLPISEAVFPDDAFRACIRGYDVDGTGALEEAELDLIGIINVSGEDDEPGAIRSLAGIEYFPGLQYLFCDNNQLTELNLSNNCALVWVRCSGNQLTALDVSKNPELVWLECAHNQLTSLDVTNNSVLGILNCFDNAIEELDVSHNASLMYCGCTKNRLTRLNVGYHAALGELYCNHNQLETLDLTGCTELRSMECGANRLTELDLSKNPALTHVGCFENQLKSLDLSKNTALTEIWCYSNQLERLDMSGCPELVLLSCWNNKLEALTVDNHISLRCLWCNENPLTELDLTNCPPLVRLVNDTAPVTENSVIKYNNGNEALCYDEGIALTAELAYGPGVVIDETNFPDESFRAYVQNFDLDGNGELAEAERNAVTEIHVSENENVTSLAGIEHFPALAYLYCFSDNLTELDLSGNPALEWLDCYNNKLTALDLSGNTKLRVLQCYNNQLATLELGSNTAMTWLNCYNNQLTALDLSGCPSLEHLYCGNNQLFELDISGNGELQNINCESNRLTALDVRGNTALQELYCGSNQLTALDLSGNTQLTGLDCRYNSLTSLDISQCPGLLEIAKNVQPTIEYGTVMFDTDDYSRYLRFDSGVSLTPALSFGPGVAIDETNFPDETFRAYVQNFDLDGNGELAEVERNAVTEIDVSGSWDAHGTIESLKGVEYFPELKWLFCYYNQISALDLSGNPKLQDLICGSNQLTGLDLSANPALTGLDCRYNSLTSLDISQCPGLLEIIENTTPTFTNNTVIFETADNSRYLRFDQGVTLYPAGIVDPINWTATGGALEFRRGTDVGNPCVVSAQTGETVYLTAIPDADYNALEAANLSITGLADGSPVAVNTDTTPWSFVMPAGGVMVNAAFEETNPISKVTFQVVPSNAVARLTIDGIGSINITGPDTKTFMMPIGTVIKISSDTVGYDVVDISAANAEVNDNTVMITNDNALVQITLSSQRNPITVKNSRTASVQFYDDVETVIGTAAAGERVYLRVMPLGGYGLDTDPTYPTAKGSSAAVEMLNKWNQIVRITRKTDGSAVELQARTLANDNEAALFFEMPVGGVDVTATYAPHPVKVTIRNTSTDMPSVYVNVNGNTVTVTDGQSIVTEIEQIISVAPTQSGYTASIAAANAPGQANGAHYIVPDLSSSAYEEVLTVTVLKAADNGLTHSEGFTAAENIETSFNEN